LDQWLHPYSDTSNTGFSPQTRITAQDAKSLRVIWSCEVAPEGAVPKEGAGPYRVGVQTTPVVAGGSVFVADGYNTVYSMDADSGALRWSVSVGGSPTRGPVHGLNFRDGSLYLVGPDATLWEVAAEDGRATMRVQGIGKKIPGSTGVYSGGRTPVFYRDSVIVGLSTQGASETGSGRGFVASYSLKSGELLWRWYAVPPAKKGPKRWHREARKGNMAPYPNDWGKTSNIGGGGVWGTMAVDDRAKRVYCGTGNSDLFVNADLDVPGPNLYTDCIVSLDAETGKMLWYYQATPHDLLGWDVGWNVIEAELEVDGAKRRAVIAGSKNNHVYVLDAETGKPIYAPVRIGYNKTTLNAGRDGGADMTSSLSPGRYSPGHLGGINAPLAFAYNTIYVATQRVDMDARYETSSYMGKRVKGIVLKNSAAPQYSSLYAIDGARGEVKWVHYMKETYQSASITVTAGMVFAIDRKGTLHILDAYDGALLRTVALGGYGRAGAAFGSTSSGKTRLFVPVSGAEGEPNRVVCLGIE
jgi:outer membrane protein assembly factor BamB